MWRNSLLPILWLVAGSAPPPLHGAEEPIPDLGDRTSDGFLVKCYWVGNYYSVEKFGGQGVVGVFGQALSPLNGKQTTTASIIITEEVDEHGNPRGVVRGGSWSSKVQNLHYWSKANQRVPAGPGGQGGGSIPTSGPDAPTVVISRDGPDTMGIELNWLESDTLSFDVTFAPLEIKGLRVQVESQTKTERWKAKIMGMDGHDEPVQAGKHTVIRLEWGSPRGDWYARWIMTRVCESGKLKLVTPHGDPRRAPRISGDGQNEYTFDKNSPGNLVINFKASVTPPEAIKSIRDRVSFTVEPIRGSSFAWDGANPGGKATVSGGFMVAKGTFTDLPPKIDDFGKKRVQLLLDGKEVEKTDIEVFFPRDAKNHPAGQPNSPNWFYYYLQTVAKLGPKPNIKYSTVHSSHFDPNADEICIDDGSIKAYTPPYGTNGTLYGIDTFAWCVTHETQHYKDWADFWDVDNQGVNKWRAAHHKTGPDDDFDGEDIPNRIEDANLNARYDAADLYDWKVKRTPARCVPSNILNDFEDWNCRRHTSMKGNHAKDWADPGMQHLTLDKWDD